jgi:hypothetical protein
VTVEPLPAKTAIRREHQLVGGDVFHSENCSRYHGSIIAVSSGRPHRFTLYHRGRGQEPVTVAGRIKSWVAVNAMSVSFQTVGFGLISAWVPQDCIRFSAECELFI